VWREGYFRNNDRPVFFDGTEKHDDERWNEISRIKRNAPCLPQVY